MKELKFSTLGDDWEKKNANTFVSPLIEGIPEQILIFSDQIKNGTIKASITPLKESISQRGEKGNESAILFRYSGNKSYYYAGIGAFGAKFFIAKVSPGPVGPVWQQLDSTGNRDAIKDNQTYHLKVECVGNKLTLFENDVRQVEVYDESYQIGQWGLRSLHSNAQFEDVDINISKPVCFVVMPFASELDFVYKVIKDTVMKFDLRCERADEIMVSKPVVEDVKQLIAEADLVIGITYLAPNL